MEHGEFGQNTKASCCAQFLARSLDQPPNDGDLMQDPLDPFEVDGALAYTSSAARQPYFDSRKQARHLFLLPFAATNLGGGNLAPPWKKR